MESEFGSSYGPTEITREDVDKFVDRLKNSEVYEYSCIKCEKKFFYSFGASFGECAHCWFSRYPEHEVKEYCKSFFE